MPTTSGCLSYRRRYKNTEQKHGSDDLENLIKLKLYKGSKREDADEYDMFKTIDAGPKQAEYEDGNSASNFHWNSSSNQGSR